jgi:hypothetical protein
MVRSCGVFLLVGLVGMALAGSPLPQAGPPQRPHLPSLLPHPSNGAPRGARPFHCSLLPGCTACEVPASPAAAGPALEEQGAPDRDSHWRRAGLALFSLTPHRDGPRPEGRENATTALPPAARGGGPRRQPGSPIEPHIGAGADGPAHFPLPPKCLACAAPAYLLSHVGAW